MREEPVKLYFLCGKMAAGKSTFAKGLARAKNAVLLVQDEFLGTLYPGEIRTIEDFVKCAARLREALSLHIRDILSHGVPAAFVTPPEVPAAATRSAVHVCSFRDAFMTDLPCRQWRCCRKQVSVPRPGKMR